MRKGTFSVKQPTSHSAAHNSRKSAPKYLIGFEDSNDKNYYKLIKSDKDFIDEAQKIFKQKHGKKMQKGYIVSKGKRKGQKVSGQIQGLVQETAITLQKHQNENDVKELFQKLHYIYGGHKLLELSVHRDEGHLVKDEIAYYLTKNMLRKENEYFIQSNPSKEVFDEKVNITEYKKVWNYHAHAKFSMFNRENGKTARMNKNQMSERIEFVSKELGLIFEPDKGRKIKKSVWQVKNEHHLVANALQKQAYNFRKIQKETTSLEELIAEQKKELHKLNSQVENHKTTEEKLENKLNEQLLKKNKKLTKIGGKLANSKKKNKVLNKEYEELEKFNRQLKEMIKAKVLTEKELKNRLSELVSSNSKLTEQLFEKNKLINSNINLELKIDKINQEINSKIKKTVTLDELLNIFINGIKKLIKSNEDNASRIKTYKTKSVAFEFQVEELVNENKILKAQVEELTAPADRMSEDLKVALNKNDYDRTIHEEKIVENYLQNGLNSNCTTKIKFK